MSRRSLAHGKAAMQTITVERGRSAGQPKPSTRDDKDITGKTTWYVRARASGAALQSWRDQNTGFKARVGQSQRKTAKWLNGKYKPVAGHSHAE